ncbi:DNA/RNA nuclease SfsA [Flexibacterium corallicola]|uniref:DNA/RNA nuclease SfsA n=1 Tax=Flexibacterium corallicola TaxID=3037259 RepID=UPI00286FAA13|nr:DNA/RNA nuclease SfsA [Pseudovibrio sp. M1P-2-3]
MIFESTLVTGRLVKRYKRFLADVILDETGEVVTAHCANSGSMMGLCEEGIRVWLSRSDNPKRKLKYSWELLEIDGAMVGINTSRPNRLVEEALETNLITQLSGYKSLRREVKYGKNSRIDILLEDLAGQSVYVEVKNVTLARSSAVSEFPDSITARGAKHLAELCDMIDQGHRSAMVYLIQRDDCDIVTIARDIDPKYGQAFDLAREKGVEFYALQCSITPQSIKAEKVGAVRF